MSKCIRCGKEIEPEYVHDDNDICSDCFDYYKEIHSYDYDFFHGMGMVKWDDCENKTDKTRALEEKIEKLFSSKDFPKSKLFKTIECFEDRFDTTVLGLYGGYNGIGFWEKYFEDLGHVMHTLWENGYTVWLIDLYNDCLDDTFVAYFGIREKTEDDIAAYKKFFEGGVNNG